MASAVESRIEPHKKAHFNLRVSERVKGSEGSPGRFSGVKYNHKPTQTSDSRTTTLTASAGNKCNLKIEDSNSSGNKDIFTFTGNRTTSKKSYVLLFDPASQQATLEPLPDTYTFNLATKNKQDVSSQYAKIFPKKSKDAAQEDQAEDDLFGEAIGDDESADPDPSNPYDFRHFLTKEKDKGGDDSDYHFASSPDYRTGTGSDTNTPQFGARKPAIPAAVKKAVDPVAKKRRTVEPDLFMKKKPGPKKAQAAPAIHLERRATDKQLSVAAPKGRGSKAVAAPASKIKSDELVHSSDDSDIGGDGEAEPASSPRQARRSPSPQRHHISDQDDDNDDAEGESEDDGGLEIEVPDARPSRPRAGGALASLGLGSNLGNGGGFNSPSNGPISLLSAASSTHGSPNPHAFTPRKDRSMQDDNVIEFGDLSGVGEDAEGEDEDEYEEDGIEVEDPDVPVYDIGPPARPNTSIHDRKASVQGTAPAAVAAENDEEDPLYQEMMAELAGGDSSEESEEE